MSNFTLADWRDTEKADYAVPEDVRKTITELQEALHRVCKENDVPYISLTIDGCNPEQGYEVNASQNLPIARVPAELLVISAVADHGVEEAMILISELFLR